MLMGGDHGFEPRWGCHCPKTPANGGGFSRLGWGGAHTPNAAVADLTER